MLLYQPTEAEITVTLGHAAARALSLRSRLDRAGDILRAGLLVWSACGWQCRSGHDPDHAYDVSFSTCGCPDHQARRAEVQGIAYCKHTLALLAYREICAAHLHARLIGGLGDAHAGKEARRAANAALLLFEANDPRRPSLFAWADARRLRPACICSTVRTARGLLPQDEGHLHAFAAWLGQAAPLPAELEALVLYRRMVALGFTEDDAAGAADAVLEPDPVAMAA